MRGDFIDRDYSNNEGVLLQYLYVTKQPLTQKGNQYNNLEIISSSENKKRFFIIKLRHALICIATNSLRA